MATNSFSIPNSSVSSHRIILGTQTSDKAQNYLQIAKIEWPNPISADTLDYDEAKEELGGHGKAKVSITFNIIQRINHPGDVNRARYQPQNPNIIATMCEDGNALVFDRSKLASIPKDNGMVEAHAILKGHEAEGYGLGWNPNEEGILATGAEDSTVRLWYAIDSVASFLFLTVDRDLKKDFSQSSKEISPTSTWSKHTAAVNDVHFHPLHKFWIGAASDDLSFSIIDTRQPVDKAAISHTEAHTDAVNAIAFHPGFEPILATGSADKSIGLWDLRNLKKKLHSLDIHKDSVVGLEWHPHEKSILASSSYDRRVCVWDLTRIGEEQTPEDAEEGPPEL